MAKNTSLLRACSKCGAANNEDAEACYVCDAPLGHPEEILGPVSVPSSEPEWRLEVAHRLEAYRARRRRNSSSADDSQAALPFLTGGRAPAEKMGDASGAEGEAGMPAGVPRPHKSERRRVGIEIAVAQPALDFSLAEGYRIHPAPPLVPVAELSERLRAGFWDAAFLLLSFAGFLLLFGSLGGQLSFGKLDAAVYGAAFFLFYAQYFALFAAFGGVTPGMRIRGLRVVSFDGGEASAAQLLLRGFGYLVSGGTLFLGFLWSLWDEDRLTWQDRISQTYITHRPA